MTINLKDKNKKLVQINKELININAEKNKFIGIAAEEQKNLFKYFQKNSTLPTAGEQSTGLGLAIAKRIIVEHNGKIGVKSEIDKGSNFYFELPQ